MFPDSFRECSSSSAVSNSRPSASTLVRQLKLPENMNRRVCETYELHGSDTLFGLGHYQRSAENARNQHPTKKTSVASADNGCQEAYGMHSYFSFVREPNSYIGEHAPFTNTIALPATKGGQYNVSQL